MRLLAVGLAVLLAVASVTATATPSQIEVLAAACNGCHGKQGAGSGAIPPLRGGSELATQLRAWREQTAAPEGSGHLMMRVARALTDAEIAGLTAHYAVDRDDAEAEASK